MVIKNEIENFFAITHKQIRNAKFENNNNILQFASTNNSNYSNKQFSKIIEINGNLQILNVQAKLVLKIN